MLACLPATLLILTDCFLHFLVKGLFFSSGPFSFIDVGSYYAQHNNYAEKLRKQAACVVFLFCSFLFWLRRPAG